MSNQTNVTQDKTSEYTYVILEIVLRIILISYATHTTANCSTANAFICGNN